MLRPMAAPTTAATTQCPTCGMKLARAGLSICSYCSAPLGLAGPAVPTQDDATRARLARMRDHKDYAPALAWVPPEEPTTEQAVRLLRLCLALLLVGLSLVVQAALRLGLAPAWRTPTAWLGALLLVLGLAGLLRAYRRIRAARAWPILHRAAIVTARRSETAAGGGPGSTVYFFALEFEDGTGGEFRFPGRGAHYELLVPGNTGVAYTRRDELLEFKAIRV
jgi:hypothetical protein